MHIRFADQDSTGFLKICCNRGIEIRDPVGKSLGSCRGPYTFGCDIILQRKGNPMKRASIVAVWRSLFPLFWLAPAHHPHRP